MRYTPFRLSRQAIPTGSLIYTKGIPPKEVKKEDVIAFYRGTDSVAIVTHRVVKNQTVSGKFITKGDVNEEKDPVPVDYDELLGKVALSVHLWGEYWQRWQPHRERQRLHA